MSADLFVLVRTWKVGNEEDTFAGGPLSRELADEQFKDCVASCYRDSAMYGPHTGNKVRVMTQDEWKRVSS